MFLGRIKPALFLPPRVNLAVKKYFYKYGPRYSISRNSQMKKQTNLFFAVLSSFVCLTATMLIWFSPLYAQGFMVRPMKMEYQVYLGQTVHQTLELSNYEVNQSIILDLQLLELTQNEQGHWGVIEPGSAIDTSQFPSCLKWIRLSTESVKVEPMQSASVRVTVKVPHSARGFYAAAIIAQTRPPEPKKGGIGIIIRFLIPVFMEVQGRPVSQKIELTNVGMNFLEQSERMPATTLVSMGIANKGLTFPRLKGSLKVMKFSKGHWRNVSQAEFREVDILPGINLNLKSDLKRRLPSGKYKLMGTLYVDGRQMKPLVKEIDFIGDSTVTDVAADTSLILEPSTLSIKAIPGSVRTTVIKVQNPSEEAVNVSVAVEVPVSLRGVSLGKLKGDDLACAEWVEVAPDNFTLRPGGRQNIRIVARLPKNPEMYGNYYAVLVLRAAYADGQSAGASTSLVWLENAKIKAKRAAQLMKLSLATDERSRYIVQAKFANVGNIHFTPKCKATVAKADGTPLLETALSGQTEIMLPLGTGDFSGSLDLSGVQAGEYGLSALMDYGEKVKLASKILPIRVSDEEGQKVVTLIPVNAK